MTNQSDSPCDDRIDGVPAIAAFLGIKNRAVRYAREIGSLPIRHKPGLGIFAFKTELLAALTGDDSLPPKVPG